MTIAVAGCSRELEPADRGSGPVRNTEVKTGGLLKKFRRPLASGDWSREPWDLWQWRRLEPGRQTGPSLLFLTATRADRSVQLSTSTIIKGLSYTLSVNE